MRTKARYNPYERTPLATQSRNKSTNRTSKCTSISPTGTEKYTAQPTNNSRGISLKSPPSSMQGPAEHRWELPLTPPKTLSSSNPKPIYPGTSSRSASSEVTIPIKSGPGSPTESKGRSSSWSYRKKRETSSWKSATTTTRISSADLPSAKEIWSLTMDRNRSKRVNRKRPMNGHPKASSLK